MYLEIYVNVVMARAERWFPMATMKEVAGHFGVSVQTMTEYVKRHLDEINATGNHAALRAGKWAFDAEAVQKME